MAQTGREMALHRLREISTAGFMILVDAGDGPKLLEQSGFADWTDDKITEWLSKNDPLLEWLMNGYGQKSLADLPDGNAKSLAASYGPSTAITLLQDGMQLGMVICHKDESLDETDALEATAAALILLSKMPKPDTPEVTTKELVYLKQVCAGFTDDEIAQELQLSLRAIKERKRKVIDDLGAKNIGHAIGVARRFGLL